MKTLYDIYERPSKNHEVVILPFVPRKPEGGNDMPVKKKPLKKAAPKKVVKKK